MKSSKHKRRTFSDEYKKNIVKRIREGERISEISKKENIHMNTLCRWNRESKIISDSTKIKIVRIPVQDETYRRNLIVALAEAGIKSWIDDLESSSYGYVCFENHQK